MKKKHEGELADGKKKDENHGGSIEIELPSGKLSHTYGQSPCLVGKSTISMAMFNSLRLPEGVLIPQDPGKENHWAYSSTVWIRHGSQVQEIWSWWSSDAKDPRSRAPWTLDEGNSMGPSTRTSYWNPWWRLGIPNFKRPPLLAAEPEIFAETWDNEHFYRNSHIFLINV